MRADRLLSLLLILRQQSRATARELAARLEVSERTVLRDIEALSVAGVPVYAERGCRGGFALLEGWNTDVSGLTALEAQAVLAAGSRSAAQALGLGSAFASGLNKLLATMPEAQRMQTVAASSRILVTADAFVPSPEATPFLGVLQRAVVDGRRIRMAYRREREQPTTRTVDPIGLVHAQGVWYLLATHRRRQRTYRVGRITSAEMLSEAAQRDPIADLEGAWHAARSNFQAALEALTVRVDARVEDAPRLQRGAATRAVDGAPPGWQRLEVPFADRRQAVGVLWSFGPAVRVHSPTWLRDELLDRARSMCDVSG